MTNETPITAQPVAWLIKPNKAAHPDLKKELVFDAPRARSDWDITPLYAAPQPNPATCLHRIADARNPVVKDGYICIDCGAVFRAADHDKEAPQPSVPDGWLEAAVAWEVCASIHETFAKGKDALYTMHHADFVKHATDCRAKFAAAPSPKEPS